MIQIINSYLIKISKTFQIMIEGYENDENQILNIVKEVRKDYGLNDDKIIEFLSMELDLKDKNILKLWDACRKWDIINIENIKNYILDYIHENENENQKLKIQNDKYVSFLKLTQNTCINSTEKCKNISEALQKNHLHCIKLLRYRENMNYLDLNESFSFMEKEVNKENFYYKLNKNICNMIIENAYSKYLKFLQDYNLNNDKYVILIKNNEEINNYFDIYDRGIDFDCSLAKNFFIQIECRKYLNLKFNDNKKFYYLYRPIIESKRILCGYAST